MGRKKTRKNSIQSQNQGNPLVTAVLLWKFYLPTAIHHNEKPKNQK